jgi:hypothetical protein
MLKVREYINVIVDLIFFKRIWFWFYLMLFIVLLIIYVTTAEVTYLWIVGRKT